MKQYFYTDGKEQFGPFSIDDITNKNLPADTLVWTEGMPDWTSIKEVSELYKNNPSLPPPIPTAKPITPKTNSSQKSWKIPKWLLIWCVFHLSALLLSYSGIKFFNQETCLDNISHDSEKFWPFTVLEFEDKEPGYNSTGWCGYSREKYFGYYVSFNGLFYDYDLADFALYIGGAFFIFLLVRITKTEEKTESS